ncbi:hypothetical protein [Nocardia wallacei]|uniref:hypothetical protein n=1 Tax=Nocardia wallacei TaxID=480035 RepID=UPI002456199E|nr:hypothetical protein [Nocardia wallacei]
MSQHPATQRRSSRQPAQIFQHTAIVFAGMASIGLTVAAGTYIVNQIAESTRPPAAALPAPAAAPPAGTPESAPAREFPRGTAVSGLVGLVAESRPLPAQPVTPPPAAEPDRGVDRAVAPAVPAQAPVRRPGMGGQLPLPGNTYVGANVATGQPDSVSMTVDTNVFTVFADRLGDGSRRTTNEITRLRTDLDTKSGEVTFAVSDPRLGQHDVRWQRHARPAIVPEGDNETA